MIKIEESSGFLTLRNFCITVDYELLEGKVELLPLKEISNQFNF